MADENIAMVAEGRLSSAALAALAHACRPALDACGRSAPPTLTEAAARDMQRLVEHLLATLGRVGEVEPCYVCDVAACDNRVFAPQVGREMADVLSWGARQLDALSAKLLEQVEAVTPRFDVP